MKTFWLQLVFLLFLFTSSTSGQSWKDKKRSHQGQPVSDLSAVADGLSDERNFQRNLNAILIPRTVGSRNHEKVRRHIADTMRGLGWNVEESSFNDQTPFGNKQFTNVIATLNPKAPRRLVVACHYDSKIEPAGVYATDSAVPCAMMLNLASTMNNILKDDNRVNNDLTLQLIFFDGEEAFVRWNSRDSIYGSRNLAAKWQNEIFTDGGVTGNFNDRIDLFVLLDLLGSGDMNLKQEERSTGRWYSRLVSIENSLRRNNLLQGRQTIFQNRRGSGGIEDDHIPFKQRGVPILHLISSPFPSVWHTSNDDIRSLDFAKIANLNKIMRVFVAEYLRKDYPSNPTGCTNELCVLF